MGMFIAEHNLALSLMDNLPAIVTTVCPDSKIGKEFKCNRTKSTASLTKVVAPHTVNKISKAIKDRELCYSIIVDESTA